MPPTRPRTTGVRRMNAQPSSTWCHTDGRTGPLPSVTVCRAAGPRAASGSRIRAMTAAATRNVSPLAYSARSTSLATAAAYPPDRSSRTPDSSARPAKRSAASGAVPYVTATPELVGRLQLPARHEVGDHRVLGRGPEQRRDLDEDRGHVEPLERADHGDRQEQQAAHDVEQDQRGPPVEPVGQHPGQRAEQEGGREPEHEDPGDGEARRRAGPPRRRRAGRRRR